MTTEATTGRRAPRMRRGLTPVLVAGALIAAGCAHEAKGGDGGDVATGTGFEATADYLSAAAHRTGDKSHKIEVRLSLDDKVASDVRPMMTGAVDGKKFHFHIDLGTVFDQMSSTLGSAPGLPDVLGSDLTMEMLGDQTTFYLRAPLFASVADLAPSQEAGPIADLAKLGDGWGRVDVGKLTDQLPTDLQQAVSGTGFDPVAAIALVEHASDVKDLGTDTIKGTHVHGLSAQVSLGDILKASGTDPSAYADIAGQGEAEDATRALLETKLPVEVWVDGDGYLRRMSFSFGIDDIMSAMGQNAAEAGGTDTGGRGIPDFNFSYGVDMFDYGTPVDLDIPPNSVDITDTFAQLAQR